MGRNLAAGAAIVLGLVVGSWFIGSLQMAPDPSLNPMPSDVAPSASRSVRHEALSASRSDADSRRSSVQAPDPFEPPDWFDPDRRSGDHGLWSLYKQLLGLKRVATGSLLPEEELSLDGLLASEATNPRGNVLSNKEREALLRSLEPMDQRIALLSARFKIELTQVRIRAVRRGECRIFDAGSTITDEDLGGPLEGEGLEYYFAGPDRTTQRVLRTRLDEHPSLLAMHQQMWELHDARMDNVRAMLGLERAKVAGPDSR